MNDESKNSQLKTLAQLGFPSPNPVFSFRTIAHLFGSTKSRCGIYLLEFSNETFYIGQAIDVVRRFIQHRRNYSNIIGFSFIPTKPTILDEVEKELIHSAEHSGLTLLNVVHASNVIGETDLDFVFSPEEQKAWLLNLDNVDLANDTEQLVLPMSQIQRFANNFQRFTTHRQSNLALECLRSYVNNCIPSPKRTEYSFWAVSCMPSTNKNSWPRLFCVNAGVMELFVVGYDVHDQNTTWAFVNVASDVLNDLSGGIENFAKTNPTIDIVESCYRDAGPHQLSLQARDESSLRSLLENKAVRKAAGTLMLRVMRKRSTIYGKYHCKQLANSILSNGSK